MSRSNNSQKIKTRDSTLSQINREIEQLDKEARRQRGEFDDIRPEDFMEIDREASRVNREFEKERLEHFGKNWQLYTSGLSKMSLKSNESLYQDVENQLIKTERVMNMKASKVQIQYTGSSIILETEKSGNMTINLGEHIDEGAYGKIYKVYSDNGNQYAVKVVNFSDKTGVTIDDLLREVKMINLATEDYFREALVDQTNKNFFIITEYFGGSSLMKFISSSRTRDLNFRTIYQKLSFSRQLMQQLIAMHAKDIVHKDIKPQNVILNKSQDKVVLIDYGLSCIDLPSAPKIDRCQITNGFGTPTYQSASRIQMILNNKDFMIAKNITNYMRKEDIYALSLTIIAMFDSLYPNYNYSGDDTDEALSELLEEKQKPFTCFIKESSVMQIIKEFMIGKNIKDDTILSEIREFFNVVRALSNNITNIENIEETYDQIKKCIIVLIKFEKLFK